MERITHLSATPVIGRPYLVPTVIYPWLGGEARAWPVFPFRHSDAEHFNFPLAHYHVDPRFLGKREWHSAGRWRINYYAKPTDADGFRTAQSSPLSHTDFPNHPPVIWRRRVCHRDQIPYQFGDKSAVASLAGEFLGHQCRHVRTGWICPHRRFRQADAIADYAWPGERHYTYVNPKAVRSANPGFCFRMAGWRRCGVTLGGLLIFERGDAA